MIREDEVKKALTSVVDPDIGIDIMSLGLIYEIKTNKNDVFILFTLTFPGCPYADFLVSEVENAVKEIKNVENVEVKLTFNPPWSPDRIDPDIRAALNI